MDRPARVNHALCCHGSTTGYCGVCRYLGRRFVWTLMDRPVVYHAPLPHDGAARGTLRVYVHLWVLS